MEQQEFDYFEAKGPINTAVLVGGAMAAKISFLPQFTQVSDYNVFCCVAFGGLAAAAMNHYSQQNKVTPRKASDRAWLSYAVAAAASGLIFSPQMENVKQSFDEGRNAITVCIKNAKDTAQDGLAKTTYWVNRGMKPDCK